jgi:hypothetical protein
MFRYGLSQAVAIAGTAQTAFIFWGPDSSDEMLQLALIDCDR